MTRQPPPDLPERKPASEMTLEERREYTRELLRITRRELAELDRPRRERKLRKGLVRPRNQAERELFLADLREEKLQAERRRHPLRAGHEEIARDAEKLAAAEQPADSATAEEVGQWMARCLERDGRLDQRSAARVIAERFGGEYTCLTATGNLAIAQGVIRAFRKAAGGPSWDQRSLCWLPRTEDDPGRKP